MDIHTAANHHSNERSKPFPTLNKVICKFYIPFEFPHASPPLFTQGRLKNAAVRRLDYTSNLLRTGASPVPTDC